MPALDFAAFLPAFFALFESSQFNGQTFLGYLARDKSERSGDEASIVDNALSAPLLALLGFSPGEQVYNAVKSDQSRPDFAPRVPDVGDCFIVEDKATGLELSDDNRQQLAGYVRANGVRLGVLFNGRALELREFAAKSEKLLFALDLAAWLQLRHDKKDVPAEWERHLESLFDLLRRDAFTSANQLAAQLAVDAQTWRENAQKLGSNADIEANLVRDLQELVGALQRDARRQLDAHLDAALELRRQLAFADDAGTQTVSQRVSDARAIITPHLAFADTTQSAALDEFLTLYARDPRDLPSPELFLDHALQLLNIGRSKPLKTAEHMGALFVPLREYAETVLLIHARQTRLRQKARAALAVQGDYDQWIDLVRETMLGGMDESERRGEFALQAAYVVFIRLLLIRVCEDKDLFPERFLSNGGLQFWQESIRRYLKFVQGNRYEGLLRIAYENAANIYAHFFTGRELFNWYQLGESGLLQALSRLAKYDFADVDSDLLGTVYNAYVQRHEKKKQGQYYTPRLIVDFILDEVGWRDKGMLGDQKRLIDPACGSGTFLVRAAKRLMDAYRDANGQITDPKLVLSRVREKIYGFDLNPFACYLAEVNLLIQVLDAVRALPASQRQTQLERFHVYNVDALAKPGRGLLALGHDSLLAEEFDVVERIKKRSDAYATGFSHVVANPPYGAKLSDDYKRGLKRDWPDVFRGQPDTYVFFYALGLQLLSASGKLGFITPNTFLMGTNTDALRGELLRAGRLERIVDLPQGIWRDAAVDCVLLFLARDSGHAAREAQNTQVNLMDLRATLDKLQARAWAETLSQAQRDWSQDPQHAMDIRRDNLQIAIETACLYKRKINDMEFADEVLRLGDIVDSSPGVDPYATEAEGRANLYIKPRRDVPDNDSLWKPLLDTTAFIGRYELIWGPQKPFLRHGNWLTRAREARYFERPKIISQDMRNKALKRRLVATYDEANFFHRKNFNTFHLKDEKFNLKYVLALFNSSLLNYWYTRKFDNVHITIAYFEQIPIFPADAQTQSEIAELVDELLGVNRALNVWREQGYRLKARADGWHIGVPLDLVVRELQNAQPPLETFDLRDARAAGLFSVAFGEKCGPSETLSDNLKIDAKFPTQVTLKFRRLWLEVPDADVRRFLLGLLSRPQFKGATWQSLEADATIRVPADADAFARVWERAAGREQELLLLLGHAAALDREIDERVLNLYNITDPAWRAKILAAPVDVEVETEVDVDVEALQT